MPSTGAVALLSLAAAAAAGLFLKRRRGAGGSSGLLEGRYRLERIIATGSMAEIWEARDTRLGRAVAIKKQATQALGPQGRSYYLREARIAAALKHPHIVEFHEVLDTPSGLYLVFEMIQGKTVRQLLIERKRLPLAEAVPILEAACRALVYVHQQGLIHRDLKPTNIMVARDGVVKLMDFGIAKRVQEEPLEPPPEQKHDPRSNPFGVTPIDWTLVFTGTPGYTAPEVQKGQVSPVSDVYSLGVCFYEMLTGETPYKTNSFYLKLDRSYVPPSQLVPGLTPEANALVYEALHPEPEQRIPTAAEFASRLLRLPLT